MKLIIPHKVADLVDPLVYEVAPEAQIVHVSDDGTPDGDIRDAQALLRWWTPPEVLQRSLREAPQLRWVHTPSAGVDHLFVPELIERRIMLTNSAGATAIPIAEFVLLFMLNHAKRGVLLNKPTDADWYRADDASLGELFEKTLLIIGFGHIGAAIARRAAGFGMRVLAARRRPLPVDWVDVVVGEHGWRDLLPEADYVVIAAPLTPATRGMFDAAAFAQMRPNAYLINIARGQIVDTDALLAALGERRIAGAGLDALPEEPLPADHPLWRMPNVTITPHIAYSSPRTRERILGIFGENLRRFVAGEELCNLVDPVAGY
ncbi:MAG TPA: D-2-hydroxyacid dehydrogenase [Roseiflexaceae bacterium]|nr:D-2-hydroxyacid dehydrogenase [Roseiflexaceae bacterium]HMP40081.1 D-2-hydroxyacid dehydrogenase [Roseiflexaceae bacterium]